jgi:hypothetical protein
VSKARAIAIASCQIADNLEMSADPVTHQSDKDVCSDLGQRLSGINREIKSKRASAQFRAARYLTI